MNTKKITSFLIMTGMIIMVLLIMTQASYAQNKKFSEKYTYNGKKIVSDFSSDKFAAAIKNMEPGDTLDYKITYTNKSKKTTLWYMRNRVLETLEDNSDQAKNGGYTYILKNGNETLFDNSAVGGEKVINKLQGLKQATNATKNFFFVQELKPNKSQVTTLHVELDGETEVNTYMDTHGALLLTYAVQDKDQATGGNEPRTPRLVRTGDVNRLIYYVALFVTALVLLVIAVLIWRRDRKRGEAK